MICLSSAGIPARLEAASRFFAILWLTEHALGSPIRIHIKFFYYVLLLSTKREKSELVRKKFVHMNEIQKNEEKGSGFIRCVTIMLFNSLAVITF